MARKRKVYDDDDGRTIADMSGVGRRSLLFPGDGFPGRKNASQGSGEKMSRADSFRVALGALGAALLVGLAFIAAFGIAILIMVLIWK
ncbi:MAG: hypothetical protein IJQ80_01460 [Clostridia bacterium]|nr:hypothetical protein [Clostridia bacterium]